MAWVRCRMSNSRTRKTLAASLRFLALHRHEAHIRSMRRLADRLSVRRVIFLPLDEGLHIDGRDELDAVAEFGQLPTPEMRAAAGLHRHQTGRQLGEELKHLKPSELLAQDSTAFAVSTMDLEHLLRQIQSDRVISDLTASQNGLLGSHLVGVDGL